MDLGYIFPFSGLFALIARRTDLSRPLLALPVEILTHILTYCLPRDDDGKASFSHYYQGREADLRLVCLAFDKLWSRNMVSQCLQDPYPIPWNIELDWRLDSVIWFVRTAVGIKLGQGQQRPWSSATAGPQGNYDGSALDHVLATVEALSHALQETAASKTSSTIVEQSVNLVCTALVFNNDFCELVRRGIPVGLRVAESRRGKNQPDKRSQVWDLSIHPRELLPLLVLDRSAESIASYLSSKENDILDVNHRHPLFGAALYNAASLNNFRVIELLLARGADPRQTGGRWHTPLHASVAYIQAPESQRLILAAGADINAQGGMDINNNRTPLMAASHYRNTRAVSLLLSQPNLDVNRLAFEDESIAHYLARAGDVKNLRALLDLHPAVDIRLSSGTGTPLHAAMNLDLWQFTEGHDGVVQILLQRGLSPLDVCPGAETDIVGWAEDIREEAVEREGWSEEEVPGAVRRILDWWEEWEQSSADERKAKQRWMKST
ncbi:ankyrin repeat-containing domain protein [Aspergillus heterothallicus]